MPRAAPGKSLLLFLFLLFPAESLPSRDLQPQQGMRRGPASSGKCAGHQEQSCRRAGTALASGESCPGSRTDSQALPPVLAFPCSTKVHPLQSAGWTATKERPSALWKQSFIEQNEVPPSAAWMASWSVVCSHGNKRALLWDYIQEVVFLI